MNSLKKILPFLSKNELGSKYFDEFLGIFRGKKDI